MATLPDKKQDFQWGVWVWIKWKPGAPEGAWNHWKSLSEVKQAWSTSGQWDCALWVDVQDPEAVEQFVWKEIRSNSWVEKTDTNWAKKWW
ncbi:hypothetical protein COB21_01315 [Candidatus Aerophobetes bacterium]|uniref:Transcription regulator AsnC/Lrp ligand binding domain-containing protein n=1 Tax=Aerophobetes bacterium TaxID=2030807 RepID=A0A2A4X6K1_UNCAE|nr:MAG: hypothetical protein COB21_01315 [Candidatus Aerophobetes bacterium]